MAYSEGQLNGAADYRVGMNIYLQSQNHAGNFSTFYWEVLLQNPTSYGSWTNNTCYWSATVGGQYREGTFTMPSNMGGVKSRVIANGFVDVPHDAYGYRPGFPNSAGITTPHSNVGDGSSGDAWVDAPRLARPPDATTPMNVDQITDTSFRYRFSGNGNGGSPITGWKAQYSVYADFSDGGTIVASSGTSIIVGRPAGVQHYVRSCGTNDLGDGPWSTVLTFRTLTAPAAPALTSPGPGELRIAWVAPAGNLVSNVTGWDVEYADNPAMTGSTVIPVGAGASPYPVNSLPPGMATHVRLRAKYSDAIGPWSPVSVLVLMSGVYASDSVEWDGAGAYASDGGALTAAQVLYSTGTAWVQAR